MSKVNNKLIKNVVLGVIIVAVVLIFIVTFFEKKSKTKLIKNDSLYVNFYNEEIDTKKMIEGLKGDQFWGIYDYLNKNIEFNTNNLTNENEKPFTAYYEISYDKSLRGKIDEVSYQINYSDEGNKICISDECACPEPFAEFVTNGEDEGKQVILVDGVVMGKDEEEIINILKSNTITQYIEYSNGKKEEVIIDFDDVKYDWRYVEDYANRPNMFVEEWGAEK